MNDDEAGKAAEGEESDQDRAALDAQIAALEQELISLLRRKYQSYWRRKGSAAAPEAASGEKLAELESLQAQIKSVFDRIRLIDKKYVLPEFRMFD